MPLQSREQQIMRAAEQLFSSRRFHEVTMDDVCRAAGVGKGTIYRFFKDKDDLFFRLVLSAFDDLCQLIRATSQGDATFEEQLTRALTEMRGFFDRKQEMFRLMQSDEKNLARRRKRISAVWAERRAELVSAVEEVLRRGIRAGAIRDDIPTELVASSLLGMVRGFARHSPGNSRSDGAVRQLMDLFLHGAAPTRDHPSESKP